MAPVTGSRCRAGRSSLTEAVRPVSSRLVFWPWPDASAGCVKDQLCVEADPPGAWTESGLTPALTKSSSSRNGMGTTAGRGVAAMLCGWPQV